MLNGDAVIRRNGSPAVIGEAEASTLPIAAALETDGNDRAGSQSSAEGKGDLLVVNREGKGNLDAPAIVPSVKNLKLSSN